MAEPLSPSISQGINRGEAAFLGESSFDPVSFSENLVKQDQQRRLAAQKQGEEDLKALIDDDFKAKWDIDAIKQFQPRIDAFRNNVVNAFKNSKGRLSPEQKILFEQEKRRIQEDVLLSNTVYDAYSSNVKKLEESASRQDGGGLDIPASRKNLEVFKDPMSNPETAKEVQELYGGNILKWRADNAIKYGLETSFSFDSYTDKIMKGENISELPIQDATGNVITKKLPGGDYLYRVEKKLSPQQASTLANRVWGETNSDANKAKEMAFGAVDESFTIDDSGNVSFAIGGAIAEEDGDKILEYAGKLDGLSKDEIKKRLAKGYLATTFERKSDKGVMTRKSRAIPQPRSGSYGSGGGGWDSKFVAVVTDEPETIKSDAIKALGLQGNEPFLPKNLGLSVVNPEKGDKYISINRLKPSGTTEEESLTLLNGKPIKVIGFKVDKNGKVLMDYAYKSNIQKGFQDGKEVSLIEKGYDLENDAKLLASISSAYSTEDRTFNRKEFIEFLRNKAGVKAKSSAEPKTRTQAQQQNKGASASPTPKKKKLPGT
jgi:hypothetical protein